MSPDSPWPYAPPPSTFRTARAMVGVIALVAVVVTVLGVAFWAVLDQASRRNYEDHLRSCLAQNAGRRESNRARRAVHDFMLEAAATRQAAAGQEADAKLKAIDLRAAQQYRRYARAQVQLPLFDCARVVKKP